MKLTDFDALTFDCYGTLIDWERGIVKGLAPLAARTRRALSRDQILEAFAQCESPQQHETPAMPYPQLLGAVYLRVAGSWGVRASEGEADAFGKSIPDWPAFSDSAEALKYLAKHFKLVILSNVDRQSFKGSNARLKVTFDAIYTAEDIGSYKPDDRNFAYLIRHLKEDFALEKDRVLHVAESLFHDHAAANRAGLASAWIHRRHGVNGWGATAAPKGMPRYDFRFESMKELAEAHRKELDADS